MMVEKKGRVYGSTIDVLLTVPRNRITRLVSLLLPHVSSSSGSSSSPSSGGESQSLSARKYPGGWVSALCILLPP
ncbi:MAG: hypothetical protein GXY18_11820 [Methanomicrobiales archaeon]|nr:hypothetical protein [Methanomicrobiales archaeon]